MRSLFPLFLALGIAFAFMGSLHFTGPLVDHAAAAEAPISDVTPAAFPVLADFEGGPPPDFFVYQGGASSVSALTQTIPDSSPLALPGQVGDNDVLTVTYNIGDFGGFGATFTPEQDWSAYDALTFDFYGYNSGQAYTVEVQDGSGTVLERFTVTFTDDFDGWRQLTFPFDSFTRGAFQEPGAPDDGFQLTEIYAWAFPLPAGSGELMMDNLALTNLITLADWEGTQPPNWFQYNGPGSSISTEVLTVGKGDPLALPGQIGDNGVLSATYNITDYAGFGALLDPGQDWSDLDGVSFWFYGSNSGATYAFELQDGTPGNSVVERFSATFVDDFTGWRQVSLPFELFERSGFQEPGAPDDGLNLIDVRAWVFPLPGGSGQLLLDELSVYGDVGNLELTVQFDSAAYEVTEGEPATVTLSLNFAADYPVSVDYESVDGSAVAGDDYIAVSGTVTFDPGSQTEQIVVPTVDDADEEDNESFLLTLSNPVSVTLGTRDVATITILDNDGSPSSSDKAVIVDDFESGLPSGQDPNGIGIGFITFQDPNGTTVSITTTVPPEPVPGIDEPNQVLKVESDVVNYGGVTHAFEDETVSNWISQDWSGYEGFAFWLNGTGNGTTLFVDILDNRNPGSTTDDAERFSYEFVDDVAGWRYIELEWDEFSRKEIGNGAPNDGFTLTEVHGWAFGSLNSNGPQIHYLDNVGLMVRVDIVDDFESGLPSGQDPNGIGIGFITFQDPNGTTVSITTTVPPEPVPGIDEPNQVLKMESDIVIYGGVTHAFEDATVSNWVSQDWSSYEGFCFWLYGMGDGTTLFVDILDNRNPGSTTDDAERFTYGFTDDVAGWQLIAIPWDEFSRKEIGNGAPNDGFTLTEVHGWAFGSLTSNGPQVHYLDNVAVYGNQGSGDGGVEVAFSQPEYVVTEGEQVDITVTLSMTSTEAVSVNVRSAESTATPDRDYTAVTETLVFDPGESEKVITLETFNDFKYEGEEKIVLVLSDPVSASLAFNPRAVVVIEDNDFEDPTLLDDFEGFHRFHDQQGVVLSVLEVMTGTPLALPGQWLYEHILQIEDDTVPGGDASFHRTFPEPRDWSNEEGLSFWYNGTGDGAIVDLQVLDNMAATTSEVPPDEWVLRWSDEFDAPAGTPPNPNYWTYEIGDGLLNEIPGWGNSELQYYTDDTENVAHDGAGNLVITVREVNTDTTDLRCWYGPCEYTSARLISWHKVEVEYGRIESRIKVPEGQGLWPAFWTLGTNIDEVGWPQAGEIDVMEFVGREPYEVFGTIHGPGYSGGQSYGGTYTFSEPVYEAFHTFAVEWEPGEIRWYVDDILYHTATPDDVAPNEWVFEHPFFLLLNVAIGGNFGGPVGDVDFPQSMIVDYVRLFGAPDTAERWDASFTDNVAGWQEVGIPFAGLTRSDIQPPNAPNDGLGLDSVWGYGYRFPDGVDGPVYLDQVRLGAASPTALTGATFSSDAGRTGSLSVVLVVGVLGTLLFLHRRRMRRS